ncbi:hypothetical protein GCM10020331_021280 [Ectobacillus funiculus]
MYRVPDPLDGRAYSLQITDLGKKELNEYKQARLVRFEELLKDWSDEEREVFGQLLKKVQSYVHINFLTKQSFCMTNKRMPKL